MTGRERDERVVAGPNPGPGPAASSSSSSSSSTTTTSSHRVREGCVLARLPARCAELQPVRGPRVSHVAHAEHLGAGEGRERLVEVGERGVLEGRARRVDGRLDVLEFGGERGCATVEGRRVVAFDGGEAGHGRGSDACAAGGRRSHARRGLWERARGVSWLEGRNVRYSRPCLASGAR